MEKIIIVEDNVMIRNSIQLNLETKGFIVYPFADAESFLGTYPDSPQDLLILDIMLPGESGISLLKKVRRSKHRIPILILTVKKEVDIKIEALELGADDYLVKPFHMKELILRVQALIRRTRERKVRETENNLIINGFQVDIHTRISECKQDHITLSEREINLLQYFCKNPGRDLRREDILEEVWGMDVDPTPRTVDNFILKFRKLYETNPQLPNHFLTIRNIGYSYVP